MSRCRVQDRISDGSIAVDQVLPSHRSCGSWSSYGMIKTDFVRSYLVVCVLLGTKATVDNIGLRPHGMAPQP